MSKYFYLKKFHIGFQEQTNKNTLDVDNSLTYTVLCEKLYGKQDCIVEHKYDITH